MGWKLFALFPDCSLVRSSMSDTQRAANIPRTRPLSFRCQLRALVIWLKARSAGGRASAHRLKISQEAAKLVLNAVFCEETYRSMKQKIALTCMVIVIAVGAYFLYDDYAKCQQEYHRGCTPAVGSGPVSK